VLRWLADENFNNDIVRALLRRKPAFDVVRAQDVGLTGIDDGALLAWAEMINLELHHMPPPPIRRNWRHRQRLHHARRRLAGSWQ
jgi:hypothetical protein